VKPEEILAEEMTDCNSENLDFQEPIYPKYKLLQGVMQFEQFEEDEHVCVLCKVKSGDKEGPYVDFESQYSVYIHPQCRDLYS
jgi:hypothetical protein